MAGRRGENALLQTVGGSMPIIFYYLLKEGTIRADPLADFLDRLQPERLTRYYLKRLSVLGREVTLFGVSEIFGAAGSERNPGDGW